MKSFITSALLFLISAGVYAQPQNNITIVIHGGAGTISRKNMTTEQEKAYQLTLQESLDRGYEVLERGGTSLEAVTKAISVLEDSPLFNAGKGAVFTHDGKNEMDAAIMNGKTLQAGAVAGVSTIKHPILAAKAVMEQSVHVMMAGHGAEVFAQEKGLEIVSPSYFYTEKRFNSLQKAIQAEKIELDHTENDSIKLDRKPKTGLQLPTDYLIFDEGKKYGTVGCVALDQFGDLAAGTSTGGMTNKRYGRIGDAPIIGAGTYANNETCAVSATGHGEYFIRSVVAYDISALMQYKGLPVDVAANEVVMKKLVQKGGEGGVIALDKNGNFTMPFNSTGMYRGYRNRNTPATVAIYKD